MEERHPYIAHLLQCIELEDEEQLKRFQLDEQHSLKALKSEGLALHPLHVTGKSFGYADYPEIRFRLPFPTESHQFRDGAAIECFCQGETPVKGILLNFEGKNGEFRLFAPDFPDWIEDEGVGIKLSPDIKTSTLMKNALEAIPENKRSSALFNRIHSETHENPYQQRQTEPISSWFNSNLNESQQKAVRGIVSNEDVLIVHGPPGTGKTTVLVEAILQLVKKGEKVAVSAPSNTAVDHLAGGLANKQINFVRVGNNSKVNEAVFPYTVEGKLRDSKQDKEIKKLKIRAEEMRKMALQYKRKFGKEEREQRNLLLKEVKSIRHEIKAIQQFNEEKLYAEAQVILGTPVGLTDSEVSKLDFDTVIIDEAGQCLEPLAWCIIPLAEKLVLAGDHLQLPPTVLSEKAARLGFNTSILEASFLHFPEVYLLDTQYRMRESIARFSGNYFYENKLKTAEHLREKGEHFFFYDTAGAGFTEERGQDGTSLINQGELDSILKLMEQENLNPQETAFISPYAGQVSLAKEFLPKNMRISTIDSFQGQESKNVIISLVRSNEEGQIGFLKDYRRMNVAMTRAKENLFVLGDSATLAQDPFYAAILDDAEQHESYKSVWELM